MPQNYPIASSPHGPTPEAILAYWTPERKAAARPVPLPGSSADSASQQPPAPADERAPTEDLFKTKPVEMSQVIQYPDCAIGKLWFTNYKRDEHGGWIDGDFTASGCVIANHGVLTAAHSLWFAEPAAFSWNLLFEPAYGVALVPSTYFGQWTGKYGYVPQHYFDHSAEAYDAGLILLNKGGKQDENPRAIGEVVGMLPYLLYSANIGEWRTVGYPGDYVPDKTPRWTGDEMYECMGEGTNTPPYEGMISKHGNMTAGSSGGPWLAWNARTQSHVVNGVQSQYNVNLPDPQNASPKLLEWFDRFYATVFGAE